MFAKHGSRTCIHVCSLQGICLSPLLVVHFDPPGWYTAERRTPLQMAMQLQTRLKQTHCVQATPNRQAVEEPLTLPKAVKVASTRATDHRRQAGPPKNYAARVGLAVAVARIESRRRALCKLVKKLHCGAEEQIRSAVRVGWQVSQPDIAPMCSSC